MKPPADGITERIEGIFHRLVALFFRRWPQPRPAAASLGRCRIVAHRGDHQIGGRLENTLPAFDAAAAAGVWGIELDVRWTRDAVPVVFHDRDTRRLFGEGARIDAMAAADVRRRFPLIPRLAEVVERYGSRQHLMVEIKADRRLEPARLLQTLARLVPGRDFHLMALDPELLDRFPLLPPAALIPIARARVGRLSRLAVEKGWAGLAGHLLPITRQTIARHHRLGQRIGTGFADSPRCLFRELSRDVDWIFSNQAVAMQRWCNPTAPTGWRVRPSYGNHQ